MKVLFFALVFLLSIQGAGAATPELVFDLNRGKDSSTPNHLIVQGRFLYFIAEDADGPGIWRTDGMTARKIFRGRAIRLGGTTNAVYFIDFKSQLFKIGDNERVIRIDLDAEIDQDSPLQPVGDLLVVVTFSGLRVTDGTPSGTHPIIGPLYSYHFEHLGKIIYTIDSNALWRLDIEHQVADKIFTSAAGKWLGTLRSANGSLYFTRTNSGKTEFWSSHGTPGSNVKLGETSLEAHFFILAFPHWFFNGTDTVHGKEVWMFDIKTRRFVLPKEVAPGNVLSVPRPAGTIGDVVIFSAVNNMWRSDGTSEGTYSLGIERPRCFNSIGSNAYFSSSVGYEDVEPYFTDTVKVFRLADIYPGRYSSEACDFTLFNGSVYFSATDALHGRELWRISPP